MIEVKTDKYMMQYEFVPKNSRFPPTPTDYYRLVFRYKEQEYYQEIAVNEELDKIRVDGFDLEKFMKAQVEKEIDRMEAAE